MWIKLLEEPIWPRDSWGYATVLGQIFSMIQSCEFHERTCSRVQLDRAGKPRTSRVNMPFERVWRSVGEIGFRASTQPHVVRDGGGELQARRKSLRDLNGTDRPSWRGRSTGVVPRNGQWLSAQGRQNLHCRCGASIGKDVEKKSYNREASGLNLFQARVFVRISALATNVAAGGIVR